MDPLTWSRHITSKTNEMVFFTAYESIKTNTILFIALTIIFIFAYAFISYCGLCFTTTSEVRLLEVRENLEIKKKDKIDYILENNKNALISLKNAKIFLAGLIFVFVLLIFFGPIVHLLSITSLTIFLVIAIVFIFSVIINIFGEVIPRKIVENSQKKFPVYTINVIYFLEKTLKLATLIALSVSKAISKLLKIENNFENVGMTKEDLKNIVDKGTKRGVFETSEHTMINNIFEFDDILVEDIMTHRTDLATVDCTGSAAEAIKIAHESGYSRIPVFDDDIDNISGILYAKDLLDLVGAEAGEKTPLTSYVRQALHVPETNTAKDVFLEMTEKKVQMAIVVDEYGGTSGIVTMEDLLEFIVGNIEDEYDDEQNHDEIEHISDTEYIASGLIPIVKLSEILNIDFPKDEDYETLSGMLTAKLGYVPRIETEKINVEIKNAKFTILENDDRKITKVKIEVF